MTVSSHFSRRDVNNLNSPDNKPQPLHPQAAFRHNTVSLVCVCVCAPPLLFIVYDPDTSNRRESDRLQQNVRETWDLFALGAQT